MVRKAEKIKDQSDVFQHAANLLESCLVEYEISGNSIRGFGKACFTMCCQFGAQRKCHLQTIFVRDIFECVMSREMIKSLFFGGSNAEGELPMLQFLSRWGHSGQ